MTFDDPKERSIFFEIHSGLPREGPGSSATTKKALNLIEGLPENPVILDIGCGPGMQTIDLANLLPDAKIIAIDTHQPFLDELDKRAGDNGFADRIKTLNLDMNKMDFKEQSFDLIWCEGAAYIMGTDKALTSWNPLLKPGGKLALSEPVWLIPDAPPQARTCWADYPAMQDAPYWRSKAAEQGYTVIADFILEERDWWDTYYIPMEHRLKTLEKKYETDQAAHAVLKKAKDEIHTFRMFGRYYGYLFLILEKDDGQDS